MQMQGMDGVQTAWAIKAAHQLRDTKIIMLSKMGHRGDAAHVEATGYVGYPPSGSSCAIHWTQSQR